MLPLRGTLNRLDSVESILDPDFRQEINRL